MVFVPYNTYVVLPTVVLAMGYGTMRLNERETRSGPVER